MITPQDIRRKALKYWTNQRFLKADIVEGTFFPLAIPFRTPTAAQLLDQYAAVREWTRVLREGSKAVKGFGYRIESKTVNHRKLGSQELPHRILILTREDYLRFIGKQADYQRFRDDFATVVKALPSLGTWLSEKPLAVLKYHDAWPNLLKVCRFFMDNPLPGRYLRELDIPGVDTKFIEQHKAVLRDMLDRTLPPSAVRTVPNTTNRHAFEQRFGLKHDLPLIRFRLLDTDPADRSTLSDISTPINEFRTLDIPCCRVFITENKVNGLSLPPLPGSIVIFGLGYGVHTLKEVSWLNNRQIIYWGDIDTHGFAMLSMLRGFFPRTRSFLMDEQTLLHFQHLWVAEPAHTRTTAELANLTPEERTVYERLRINFYGENIRLEQEPIAFGYVLRRLESIVRQ